MAVASQYGIHSLRQTVGTVKFAVWKSFTENVHLECANFVLLLYCECALCVLCLHFVATFGCNK